LDAEFLGPLFHDLDGDPLPLAGGGVLELVGVGHRVADAELAPLLDLFDEGLLLRGGWRGGGQPHQQRQHREQRERFTASTSTHRSPPRSPILGGIAAPAHIRPSAAHVRRRAAGGAIGSARALASASGSGYSSSGAPATPVRAESAPIERRTSMSGRSALVIGGGVIGVSSAYYLARDGWEVTL